MEKAQIAKFKARIKKAQCSMSVMGDMLLTFDIDAMTLESMQALQAGLLLGRTQVSYQYLNERIVRFSAKVA